MTFWRARNRSSAVMGRSGFGLKPKGRLRARITVVLAAALIPSLIQLQIEPAAADPVRMRFDIPQSPTKGASSSVPVQRTGTAKNLPHLVGPEATQTSIDTATVKGGKRPKGALLLDEPHELADSSIEGLKTPPPLPEGSEPEPASPPTGNAPAAVPPARNASATAPLPRPAVVRSGVKERARDAQVAVTLAGPTVSNLSSSGQLSSGLWTFSMLTPTFSAYVSDAECRELLLKVEVEHDPSAAGQGSGLIWSGQSSYNTGACGITLTSSAVASGKLQDGWLIRWRVRGQAGGVDGPWSEWQAGTIDTTKPTVSNLSSSGQLASGLWTFSTLTPTFSAYVDDPECREFMLKVEVEHDPSAAGQGSGLIWTGQSPFMTGACGSTLSSSAVPTGTLQDGWLIRWRVRGQAGNATGPWSEWQAGRIDTTKPTVSNLSSSGQLASGLWTFSTLTPTFSAYVDDPECRE
ncbi:hypothetical protein, partial [Nonomuraea turcica]|uniref:hypothetical protein n=1 Tax=Nonomuraea sp. G32 TaxID=3067274 RepID=UPI00273BF4E9